MFHNDLYCKNLIIQKEQDAKFFPSKKRKKSGKEDKEEKLAI
jgi:hypothetical protein